MAHVRPLLLFWSDGMLVTNNTATAEAKLQSVVINLRAKVRRDTMEGRDFLVVPMVMLTEGVHEGSNGPLYYPGAELGKTPAVWNYKPIVVYHPTMNGQPVSACDPTIINSRKVGVIMNTKYKGGKLHAEAWLETNRLQEVDERVLGAIQDGQMVEVSTGLFTDNEQADGEWQGEAYKAIARNYRPDHLAILPDQKGACSIADGAGLLRNTDGKYTKAQQEHAGAYVQGLLSANALSHSDVHQLLNAAVQAKVSSGKNTPGPWVMDVFDSWCVYENGGKLYRQDYTVEKGAVQLNGTAKEVTRVTTYKTRDELATNKEHAMKEKLVNALIANAATGWTEEDREALMKFDEAALQKMQPVANAPVPPKPKADEEEEDEETENKGGKGKAPARNAAATPEPATPAKPQTVEEYIANAPAGMRDVLVAMKATHDAEKAKLVGEITANEANTFTKEWLGEQPMDMLRAMAKLATKPQATRITNPVANYAGQAPVAPATNAAEEPLVMPSIEFGKR